MNKARRSELSLYIQKKRGTFLDTMIQASERGGRKDMGRTRARGVKSGRHGDGRGEGVGSRVKGGHGLAMRWVCSGLRCGIAEADGPSEACAKRVSGVAGGGGGFGEAPSVAPLLCDGALAAAGLGVGGLPVEGAGRGEAEQRGRARRGAEEVARVQGEPQDGVARVQAQRRAARQRQVQVVDVVRVEEGQDVTDYVRRQVRQR